MKQFLTILFLCVPTLLTADDRPAYQTDFPPEEFQSRWQRIYDKIGNDCVAVPQGVSMTEGFQVPHQSSEFYYLSGVETPHAYLLLDGRRRKTTLYLPPRNARLEASEGKVLSATDEVASTDEMRSEWIKAPAGSIYTPFTPAEGTSQRRLELIAANAIIASDYWDGRLPREARFVELLRARYQRTKVQDLTPILDELRSVKSTREIALSRHIRPPRLELTGAELAEAKATLAHALSTR